MGVVTPHRAQQALIVDRLQRLYGGTVSTPRLIRDAVDTVERFQGQERDVMIATFALGNPDAIRDEDEFLLSLNRSNVMASRARAKLVVLVSREVVDHVSGDLTVLHHSQLLKTYAESFVTTHLPMPAGVCHSKGEATYRTGKVSSYESFCAGRRPMMLGWARDGQAVPVLGTVGFR